MSDNNNKNDTSKPGFLKSVFDKLNLSQVFPFVLTMAGGLLLAMFVINMTGQSDGFSLASSSKSSSCNVEGEGGSCIRNVKPDVCMLQKPLCDSDMEIARIAWKYFENNYQPTTGLFNSVDQYTSTTMWDTGSALAATVAAHDIGLIEKKEFDDKMVALLKTLKEMKLFNNEAPNKAYNTVNADMVDYGNNPTPDGIGVSALDLARIISWLNMLSCLHPKYAYESEQVIARWKFDRLIKDGQMFGLLRDPVSKTNQLVQEGRLGYEQYAGKIFRELGFDQHVSATYNNKFARSIDILDVPVAYDMRDPRDLGAYNYVVTESYVMDAMENGVDDENKPLIQNIFDVQKKRYEKTGIVTAISEDNIDREPWFLYNTIFTAGLPFNTITDMGVRYDHLKTVSTKAAFSLAVQFPDDPYSQILMDRVSSAYDPEKGWNSGVYENGLGYNTARTANTNGIILSLFLYKKYGSLYPACDRCKRNLKLDKKITTKKACDSCVS